MKNIVLIPNPKKDKGLSVTVRLVELLSSYGAVLYAEEKYRESLPRCVNFYKELPESTELIIVVGGDGSVLDASVLALERDVCMLGVNLGKVGYLSEIEPDNLEILEGLFNGSYKIDEKMLLSVAHQRDGATVYSSRLAVNDVIISHNTFLGIADFVLENSSSDYIKYRADGMILSTPAGSTAYSLSAGGPIVSHDIDSIVATPICPHSFFDRSIIFKATEQITLKNAGENELHLSIDGRFFTNLIPGDRCIVKMADKKLKMISFTENNMFSTLFRKMKMLEDIV